MLLSNMFSNSLDDLIDSFDKENIISYCQNRDVTSPKLPIIERNSVTSHNEIDGSALKINKNASYTKMDKGVLIKNRNASYFEIEEEISDENKVTSDINFFY